MVMITESPASLLLTVRVDVFAGGYPVSLQEAESLGSDVGVVVS